MIDDHIEHTLGCVHHEFGEPVKLHHGRYEAERQTMDLVECDALCVGVV